MMPWRDYILNNALWKVVSVIAAVLIWFAIHSNIQDSFKSPENRILTTSTVSRTLPVTVITTATDMRGFTITPTNVTVTVRAEAPVLNNLKVSAVTVRRDWVFSKAWLYRELSGVASHEFR